MSQSSVRLIQGQSFSFSFTLSENGYPVNIGQNEDIAVGFYPESSRSQKYIAKFSTGEVKYMNKQGNYQVTIDGTQSTQFVGNVRVEIAIFKTDHSEISHADKVLQMFFEEREINSDI